MSQTPARARHSSMILMTILLLSGCSGGGGGTGGSTGAACQTNCPTAVAGPEQAVVTGAAVTLDGSGSTSGTSGLITYHWTFSKPAGSGATLAGATTARPTFTPDVAGTYAARLVVREGGVSSPPDTVTITCGTGNLTPIANAGPDRTELLGTPVTLDGTGSRDPNGTPITYAWRVVTQPSGSQAALLSATSRTPSFTPQVAGLYTLALTVSDGSLTSLADEVTITVTADNCPPVANAGPDQTVTTGQVVTLTGAGSSDPNDDPLTYSWRFQSKPDGSTATLAAATAVSSTFTADMAGLYVLSLVVSDGMRTSAPDTVVVEAKASRPRFNQGSGFNGPVRSVVVAQDGSGDVYVGGQFTAYNGTGANRLIRLRPSGTVAQTFGQGFDNTVRTLARATDGSHAVYASGEFSQFDGQPTPPLIRLTSTGLRDSIFQPVGLDFFPMTLAMTEDGSRDVYAGGNIVAGVPGTPVSSTIGRIARLNPDGSPDLTFPVNTGISGEADDLGKVIASLAVLPGSGKLYVGGDFNTYQQQSTGSLLRLNPDATRDSSFVTGTGIPALGPTIAVEVIARAEDGTGDLYAGGRIGIYNGTPVTLGHIRIHENGALDTTYAPAIELVSFAIAPAQDGTGDVFISGFGIDGSNRPPRLLRLHRNGALAPTFLEPTMGGVVFTIAPVLDGTGDVYIGGEFTTYNGAAVNNFARIHADGSLASVVSGP